MINKYYVPKGMYSWLRGKLQKAAESHSYRLGGATDYIIDGATVTLSLKRHRGTSTVTVSRVGTDYPRNLEAILKGFKRMEFYIL